MTDFNGSIVPTPEEVENWYEEAPIYARDDADYEEFIARKAAKWGADRELEACCRLLEEVSHGDFDQMSDVAGFLQVTRRPTIPSSLKEQAMKLLDKIEEGKQWWDVSELKVIRRALSEVPGDD
jgi:hypothetical protein